MIIRIFKIFKNLVVLFAVALVFFFIFSRGPVYEPDELELGVTFSRKQAEELGLDWRQTYVSMFKDLGVRRVRLAAYWNEIEPAMGAYVWEDLDWQIAKAGEFGAEVILAVGGRLPRWPECHYPEWTNELTEDEREGMVLSYIKEVVIRYKDQGHISAWQVENEPFLSHFGDCPKLDKNFLDDEIMLVRSLDERPVVVTDSGELSIWYPAARRADIFGTTMYRDTYSAHLDRYIHYPITPAFFRFKKNIVRWFAHPDEWIVVELQAEPWAPVPYHETTQAERDKTMNLQKFREMMDFARRTGFKTLYLWGVEWWYWERDFNNNSAILEEAKGLFE